jgi:hypothetical protein
VVVFFIFDVYQMLFFYIAEARPRHGFPRSARSCCACLCTRCVRPRHAYPCCARPRRAKDVLRVN